MESSLAYHISSLRRAFVRYCNERLSHCGLTPGLFYFVLYIGKNPGCTQKRLVQALRMDVGYTARAVARLESDGFILQTRDPRDRRAHNITLTPKGEEIFTLCHSLFEEWDASVLGALSEEDRASLFSLMAKLTAHAVQVQENGACGAEAGDMTFLLPKENSNARC